MSASPSPLNISSLFASTVARIPSSTAIIGENGPLSYQQLSDRSARLAAILAKAGIAPGTTVGLCLERSPELVMGVLAILKAGAAYVPIDSFYPADRITMMLEDA